MVGQLRKPSELPQGLQVCRRAAQTVMTKLLFPRKLTGATFSWGGARSRRKAAKHESRDVSFRRKRRSRLGSGQINGLNTEVWSGEVDSLRKRGQGKRILCRFRGLSFPTEDKWFESKSPLFDSQCFSPGWQLAGARLCCPRPTPRALSPGERSGGKPGGVGQAGWLRGYVSIKPSMVWGVLCTVTGGWQIPLWQSSPEPLNWVLRQVALAARGCCSQGVGPTGPPGLRHLRIGGHSRRGPTSHVAEITEVVPRFP